MRLNLLSSTLLCVAVSTSGVQAQQPAYSPSQGPVVLLDANYRNLLSLRLRPSLTETFTADGYRVIERQGGSLLVITDHMPFPGAVQELTRRFGFELANGHALPSSEDRRANPDRFSRSDGSLADHPITAGRSTAERVDAVETYGGAAFRVPAHGQSLMTFGSGYEQLLPKVAWQFTPDTPREPIAGWSQGGVVQVGRGRVAVFTEAGFFMAPPPDEVGSDARRQNRQFLLNVAHWLSGLLN